MLFGGEITDAAWREARWSFIHGNFAATVLLCQGLAEHLLGSFLHAALLIDDLPKRVSFAETLRRCQDRKVISDRDATDLRRLMELRNPLSHFRDLNDPAGLTGRVLSTMEPAQSICGGMQALQSALQYGSSRCRRFGSGNRPVAPPPAFTVCDTDRSGRVAEGLEYGIVGINEAIV